MHSVPVNGRTISDETTRDSQLCGRFLQLAHHVHRNYYVSPAGAADHHRRHILNVLYTVLLGRVLRLVLCARDKGQELGGHCSVVCEEIKSK